MVKELRPGHAQPGRVHRMLAELAGQLEHLGRPRRSQLLVTVNYDSALERAFDERAEPYDLAIFMATGRVSPPIGPS